MNEQNENKIENFINAMLIFFSLIYNKKDITKMDNIIDDLISAFS